MVDTGLLPDAEVIAVAWARNNPALNSLLSGRVSTRLPSSPTFPHLRVFRVSGTVDDGEAPLDQAHLQWDAYAGTGAASPDYETASLVARTLIAQTRNGGIKVPDIGTILGFQILAGPTRMDEPTTGWARYLVETLILTREGY